MKTSTGIVGLSLQTRANRNLFYIIKTMDNFSFIEEYYEDPEGTEEQNTHS